MLETTSDVLSGDPTCSRPCYFCVLNGALTYASDIREIIKARDDAALATDIDHTAISHLLHDGFVPQPRTVFRDIYVVSTGFTARLVNGTVLFSYSFPFTKAKSRQDQIPDPERLLTLLAAAIEVACSTGSNALLMLSAGLDSSSLAVAAKAAGRDDVLCVTYAEAGHHEEAEYARRLCIRLGLRHETYVLDPRSDTLAPTLLRYAALAPQPCADPALIACIAPVAAFSDQGTTILDGSGSDSYFWKKPRALDLIKFRLGLSRLPAVRRLRGLVPMHLRYERLLSTPLEPMLYSGPRLRHHDTRQFYPNSVDTHQFWLDEFMQSTCPAEEVRSSIRSTFIGPAAHMLKIRNAGVVTGATAHFPWANATVADYCFNLPEDARFSQQTGKAKIIVRSMLRQFVDYEDDIIGKRVFSFGKRAFIQQQLTFIREQVLACELWSSQIESHFGNLKALFLSGRKTENALLDLLMVSLWHNHWVTRRLAPIQASRLQENVAA